MKFSSIKQIIKANNMFKWAAWLKQVQIEDLAAVSDKHPEFKKHVLLGLLNENGFKKLDESPRTDYKTAVKNILSIEFRV
jgi:peroxiredoxin